MLTLYIIILFICLAFVFLDEYFGKYRWGIYAFFGLALILLCTFKTVGADADSENYALMFEHYDDKMTMISAEFSFRLIAEMLNHISSDVSILFFVYASISIAIKFYAIKENTELVFLSLFVFLSHYYILHDMIEIRAGVAAALFLLALKPLCDGNKRKAILLLCCGTFFHYSLLVVFPLLFFSNATLSKTWKIVLASVVPLGYVAYFLHFDLLLSLPIPYIGTKLEIYQDIKELGGFDEIYVFKNPLLLITIMVYYMLLYFYDTVYKYKPQLPILLKTMGLSLASFFFFSSLPILSGRLYELYGVVNIFTFTYLYYIIKPAYAAKSVIAIMAFIIMFMDIYVYELIKPI